MYKVSKNTTLYALVTIVAGIVLWVAGLFMTAKDIDTVKADMKDMGIAHIEDHHADESHGEHAVYKISHEEHEYHKANNRPWSALYTAILFFTLIGFASSAFMAIQHAAQVGWSMVVIRVMEGLASFVPVGGVLLLIFFALNAMHIVHVFEWMNPAFTNKFVILNESGAVVNYVNEITEGAVVNGDYDSLIDGKKALLNSTTVIAISAMFIAVWTFFIFRIKSLTLKLDNLSEGENVKKAWLSLRNTSAAYLVVFAVTSSIISWIWIMSIEPHWFSTLFGWYTFASYFVSAIAMMLLISLFLKGKGVLQYFTQEHQHDLTKFMFGISIFWTYLWFSQFVLIWYPNIPEEVTYYIARFDMYGGVYLLILSGFVLPVLVLLSSSIKRKAIVVKIMAIFIIAVHYLDVYFWIMPGSVGRWVGFGLPEVGAILFALGIFLFVVNKALASRSLEHSGSPFWHESKIYHYPF